GRGRRLPAVVRGGGRARPAACGPVPGGHGGSGTHRSHVPRNTPARHPVSVHLWTDDRGDGAPSLDPAGSGCGGTGSRLRWIRGGSALGGGGIGSHPFLRVLESLRYTRPNALTREQYAHASMTSDPEMV